MIGSQQQANLVQRIGVALAMALRNEVTEEPLLADGRIRRARDLLIKGIDQDSLPSSLDRTRLNAPHSAAALTINSFLPWQAVSHELPLSGQRGFNAIQFEVRCPTGLRGTPPHLDLLALRDDQAVAVTVRSVEYLGRRRASVAMSYDRLFAETPGLKPWAEHLARWRKHDVTYRHVDLAALVKYALALGRTFPDRPSTLLYLFWEPLDALAYDEFRRHRDELASLADALRGARVDFAAQSFDELWREWAELDGPPWLGEHVGRLRRRYAVTLATN